MYIDIDNMSTKRLIIYNLRLEIELQGERN